MRFLVSLRLGEPPSIEPVSKRLERYPWLRFKLDPTSSWGERLVWLSVRVPHRLRSAHRLGTRAGTVPSAKRSRSLSAARAWAALAIGCPCSDCTSA